MTPAQVGREVAKAIRDPDKFCLQIIYRDDNGRKTRRIVSPSRWGASGRYSFSALCTARQEYRWFKTASVELAELVDSSTVLMPTEIEEIKGDNGNG